VKTPLFALTIAFTITLYSEDNVTVKYKLKSDMTINYKITPKSVNSLSKVLTEGIFYGRLRSNSFLYNKKGNDDNDYVISAIGGSLIYRSAYFKGFGLTTAFYSSNNLINIGDVPFYKIKSAKDTFSRYLVAKTGSYSINTLGQIFLEYKIDKIDIKIGRFLFESMITSSNDSKMIPNAFEGVLFKSRNIFNTRLQVAYLTKQKLRDHENFHHLLAYEDIEDDIANQWRENDDSSMNRGITLSELKKRGIDDRMVVFDFKNNSLEDTTIKFNYSSVTELLSYSIFELNHRFHIDNLIIIPSFKLMYQFDDGAGEIANANLKGDTRGYRDLNSLDTNMFASRIDFVSSIFRFRFGYSKIADKADFITPWRAFPTKGYTRAMGQSNWYANTKTYMLRGDLFVSKDLRFTMKYAIQDFDDKKVAVQSDSDVFTFDILKRNFLNLENLYMKFRFANVMGDDDIISSDGKLKSDPSYSEARFELNYLF